LKRAAGNQAASRDRLISTHLIALITIVETLINTIQTQATRRAR
jgi:hypothetical protein